MRRAFVLLPWLTWAAAARAEAPTLAVFEVEAGGVALGAPLLGRLTDYLESRLGESGQYRLIPRQELRRALADEKAESYRACYDESCQIEIGKELAASHTLATRLGKLGGSCVWSVKLFELRTAATLKTSTAEGPCDEAAVFASLKVAIQSLLGTAGAPPLVAVGPAAIQVPTVHVASAGLSDEALEAEALLDAAERAQGDAAASHEKRRDAWCALATLPPKKNPYAAAGKKACAEWKRFIAELAKAAARLDADEKALRTILSLARRTDDEKRAALDKFLAAHAASTDRRVATYARVRARWPLRPEALAAFLDRPPAVERAWRLIESGDRFQRPKTNALFPLEVRWVGGGAPYLTVTYEFRADGLPTARNQVAKSQTTRTTYTYDADGDLAEERESTQGVNSSSESTRVYHRDDLGRVASVAGYRTQTGAPPVSWTETYTYDAEGRLAQREGGAWGPFSVRYTYGSDGLLLRVDEPARAYTYRREPNRVVVDLDSQPSAIVTELDEVGRPARVLNGEMTMTYIYAR